MLTKVGLGLCVFSAGGREIFRDDLDKFVAQLTEAGVAPTTVYGELSEHMWFPLTEVSDFF